MRGGKLVSFDKDKATEDQTSHTICQSLSTFTFANKRKLLVLSTALRISDVYPGSRISDPDPTTKEERKKICLLLKIDNFRNMGWGSGIRKKPIPDPGGQRSTRSRIRNNDCQLRIRTLCDEYDEENNPPQ
jgi:hypothetical protein